MNFTLNTALLSLVLTSLLPQLSFANQLKDDKLVYDAYFPIWAQEAIDLGHQLPKPYGFSINYMNMSQPLMVDSVGFSGLGDVIDKALSIQGSQALQDSETLSLRGDVWLLPFLNVYGILGQTKGSSVANVQLSLAEQPIGPHFDFILDFSGISYGAGTTIVGGIGNWFGLVDVNYTKTSLDILEGAISTLVLSPRVGYRWQYNGRDLQLWGGAMYQDVEQNFAGKLADIGVHLPAPLPSTGKFKVNQGLASNWNGLIGGQASVSDSIDALLEIGFGTRSSVMLGLGYRF
ncbi:virulence protein [Agarivorans sp.]|uniref:virulence protein n=1 Tax=Agarivorans sp. TaxID=1872412 RepID=UPI003CFE1AB0